MYFDADSSHIGKARYGLIVLAALVATLALFEASGYVVQAAARYAVEVFDAGRFAPESSITELAEIAQRGLLASLTVFLLLFAWSQVERFSVPRRALLVGAAWGTSIGAAHWLVSRAYMNIVDPHFFDFVCCFYLGGKVAAGGLNFYDPSNYLAVFAGLDLPFTPGSHFFEAEDLGDLETGFLYPAPTMLYFVLLGFFDLTAAQIIWAVVSGIVLAADVVLLRRIFFPNASTMALPLVAALCLLSPAAYRTVFFQQTTFIVLLTLLLCWQARNSAKAGAWAAIAMFTKPFMGILGGWLLLRKQWRGLLVLGVTVIAICIVTIVIFDASTFFSYFTNNSVRRLNNIVYVERPNQSLLATVLRLTDYHFTYTSPLLHPAFIVTATLLGLITVYLVYRLSEQDSELTLALSVVFALLVYPATWSHLSLLLIPAILLLYNSLRELGTRDWIAPAFAAAIYAVMQVSPFTANLLVWAALVLLCTARLVNAQQLPAALRWRRQIRQDRAS